MERRIIEITDPAMARAVAHPLRRRVLTALTARTASPRELAAEWGESLPKLSYHVRQLAQIGLIELVEEKARRGVKEHYYTATATRRHISPELHASLPPSTRSAISSSWLQDVSATIAHELAVGAYDHPRSRLDRLVVSLTPDSQQQLADAVDDLVALALRLEAADRAGQDRHRVVLISMLTDPVA